MVRMCISHFIDGLSGMQIMMLAETSMVSALGRCGAFRYEDQSSDFFVLHRKAEWIVRSDNLLYGPYATCGDAFVGAVAEAQAVGLSGIPSTVIIEDENLALKIGWRYGIDPLPLRCR
ncbi:hypothetical protein TSO221_16550 [Azospirillum sp. TSO22-1]|nr:hypothetical protein TSO221_16550 [Azospirillum sp. TSO22-1]